LLRELPQPASNITLMAVIPAILPNLDLMSMVPSPVMGRLRSPVEN
jgi:hypothetical protein